MLDRLKEALSRVLCAVAEDPGKRGAGPGDGAGDSRGDTPGKDGGASPPTDDAYPTPPPPPAKDTPRELEEDITYRDDVVEVNIKSDFEGEITMNEDTKKAVEDLKSACETYLAGQSQPAALRSAIDVVCAKDGMGGSSGNGDGGGAGGPGPNVPSSGGDRPPFVTVNVNVSGYQD